MFISQPLPPLHSAFQPQVFSASANFPPRNSISPSLLNADLCQRFLQNVLSLHNNSPDNSCGFDIHKKDLGFIEHVQFERLLLTIMSEKSHLRKRVGLLPAGLAGTGPNGSFFESPSWVDQSKAPGTTSQVEGCLSLLTIGDQEGEVAAPGYWIDKLTGKTFFFSPNLVWILIALTDYFLFPYDFQSAKSFENLEWVLYRQGL